MLFGINVIYGPTVNKYVYPNFLYMKNNVILFEIQTNIT